MPHTPRYVLAGVTIFLITILLGCGGASSPAPGGDPTNPQPPAAGFAHVPAPVTGAHMPFAPPNDLDVENPDRSTSAVYKIFFRDVVNQSSGGRWSPANNSGTKSWTLSNTYFSSPKAWVLGQNYWNYEDDDLISNGFDVEDGTDGLAISFYARWNIAAGDHGTVYFWDGTAWQQVVDFTAGSNPSYPAYDKYYFQLPANTSGLTQNCNVNFHFESNSSGTNWGFGVDSVAVYQTQLNPAANVTATDGTLPGEVEISWNHNNAGTLAPDFYDLYRAPMSNAGPGTYTLFTSVPYSFPTLVSDVNGTGDWYSYKIKARKSGWPDSPESNEDSGFGIGTWDVLAVDETGDVGQYTSLTALASGNPAISYQDLTNGNLKFAYSTTADGSGGWNPVMVDGATSDVGVNTSLAIINGNPAISYYDNTNANLKYAYSSEADGSSGWTPVEVDTGGTVGQYSALAALASGNPAISYYDTTNANLKYAYSSTADGSSSWTPVTVDNSGTGAVWTSLALIDGNPAISYQKAGDLMYAYSSMADGSAGWTVVTVDDAGADTVGAHSSLAVVNGFPAICYYDETNGDLKYAHSTQADGSADWTDLIVESTDNVGDFCSLAVIYGKPAISYRNASSTVLMFAISSEDDGGSGWTSTIANNDSIGAAHGDLALIDGKPAISFHNNALNNTMYAWLE